MISSVVFFMFIGTLALSLYLSLFYEDAAKALIRGIILAILMNVVLFAIFKCFT